MQNEWGKEKNTKICVCERESEGESERESERMRVRVGRRTYELEPESFHKLT